MQEGFHWTVKSGTQAMFQPLHKLPIYVRTQVKQRNDTWLAKEGSIWREWNEGAVLKGLEKSGCQQLIDKAKEFLTDEGFRIMLDELRDGCVGYQVTKLSRAAAETVCESIISTRSHRAASASYFRALLRATVPHRDDVFLQVTSNVGNETAHDVVMVSENGSFACTEPFFAQMCQPGRHILACFHAQFCNINVLLHYHPRYLRKFSKPKSPLAAAVAIPDLSRQDKIRLGTAQPAHNRGQHRRPQISALTSWSWATRKAAVVAGEMVLGGAQYEEVLHPPLNAVAESLEAKADQTRKALNLIKSAPPAVVHQAAAFVQAQTANNKRKNKAPAERRDPKTGALLDQPPLGGRSVPAKRKAPHGGASTKRTKKKSQ